MTEGGIRGPITREWRTSGPTLGQGHGGSPRDKGTGEAARGAGKQGKRGGTKRVGGQRVGE